MNIPGFEQHDPETLFADLTRQMKRIGGVDRVKFFVAWISPEGGVELLLREIAVDRLRCADLREHAGRLANMRVKRGDLVCWLESESESGLFSLPIALLAAKARKVAR